MKMDREKMRCYNTTERREGVGGREMGGRGLELSRQSLSLSLPPGWLLMLGHYQGGRPSSCTLSVHDEVINAFGYRAIPHICSLSPLQQGPEIHMYSMENQLVEKLSQKFGASTVRK